MGRCGPTLATRPGDTQATGPPVTLSVLTLNLWHDAGPYARRVERIREWIDRLAPDLIGFQEALRGSGRDQVAEILGDRGYHCDYVCAARLERSGTDLDEGEFGNAVASRWPIVDREALRLPDGGDRETRAALSVTLEAPFGPVGLTCTHLNWKFRHGAIREKQVVAVCDLALRRRPRSGFPPLLVGDFNAEPESAEIRYVTGLQSQGRSQRELSRRVADGGRRRPGNHLVERQRLRPHRPGAGSPHRLHLRGLSAAQRRRADRALSRRLRRRSRRRLADRSFRSVCRASDRAAPRS